MRLRSMLFTAEMFMFYRTLNNNFPEYLYYQPIKIMTNTLTATVCGIKIQYKWNNEWYPIT